MIKKVEHIGIAVLELEKAIILYENLLNTPCYKIEEVGTEFVKTAFFQLGASKIELVAATKQTSPIAKFITKRGKDFIILLLRLIISKKKSIAYWV